jgi:hypothetical protein
MPFNDSFFQNRMYSDLFVGEIDLNEIAKFA